MNIASDIKPDIAELESVQDESPLKKWKCLSAKQSTSTGSSGVSNVAQSELTKYLIEISNSPVINDALEFWKQRRPLYPSLAPLAEDLITAPATHVLRINCLGDMLKARCVHFTDVSLEMRVFLKLNAHLCADTN